MRCSWDHAQPKQHALTSAAATSDLGAMQKRSLLLRQVCTHSVHQAVRL